MPHDTLGPPVPGAVWLEFRVGHGAEGGHEQGYRDPTPVILSRAAGVAGWWGDR